MSAASPLATSDDHPIAPAGLEKFPATWVPPNIAGSVIFDPEVAEMFQKHGNARCASPATRRSCYDLAVKKVVAGIVVLAGLAVAGVLAAAAVERDRDYLRL